MAIAASFSPPDAEVGYDFIGDTHGDLASLEALLVKLGYQRCAADAPWRHDSRTAVFLGDFVDRGPDPLGVCDVVAAMVAAGSALAVMGNHDFNLATISTTSAKGKPLRSHSPRHLAQSSISLDAIKADSERGSRAIAFLSRLPLWLDIPGAAAVVHACPNRASLDALSPFLAADNAIRPSLDAWTALAALDSPIGDSRSDLLSGPECHVDTPYRDADGNLRTEDRVEWWRFSASRKLPVFFGHYAAAEYDQVVFPSSPTTATRLRSPVYPA